MELDTESSNKSAGFFCCAWKWLKELPEKFNAKVHDVARNTKKVGQDDPRRVIHSLKFGLALSVVSIFYFYQPLYNTFGESAIWALMTVVVVFEFSVGATLAKGLNRGIATILAAELGVGAHHISNLSGHTGEPILLGLFVFLQAAISTFIRFYPKIKARYDYGLLIFILTFCLVSVSGFRQDEILELAHKRISTIVIGGIACAIVSIAVCPVWAGEDLHNLIALNIEKLSNFLEGFGDEYFNEGKDGDSENDKSFLGENKSVLNSKSSEESLANFARWEPGHGQFQFRHPWRQYLQVGELTRQCAYRLEALYGYLSSDIKESSSEVKTKIQEACTRMITESCKALNELALAIKTMTQPCFADSHIENAKTAVENLNSFLQSDHMWEDTDDLLQVMPVLTVSSIIVDVVNCTNEIAESVYELASKADFKRPAPIVSPKDINLGQSQTLKSDKEAECPEVVVTVTIDTVSAVSER